MRAASRAGPAPAPRGRAKDSRAPGTQAPQHIRLWLFPPGVKQTHSIRGEPPSTSQRPLGTDGQHGSWRCAHAWSPSSSKVGGHTEPRSLRPA